MRTHLADLEREAAAWRARQEAEREGRCEPHLPAADATKAAEIGIVGCASKVNALEEPTDQASADARERRVRGRRISQRAYNGYHECFKERCGRGNPVPQRIGPRVASCPTPAVRHTCRDRPNWARFRRFDLTEHQIG
jgi:hypothetical protein